MAKCGAGSRSNQGELTFSTLVEVAGEHHSAEFEAQVPYELQQRDAHGLPSGEFVVDVNVGDREVGARLFGSSAELASNNHALDSLQGMTSGTH